MLSDPQQRRIYDVYGRLGLKAGLEVADTSKGMQELAEQWQAFQKSAFQQRIAQDVAPNTRVLVNSTAAPLIQSINTESGSCFIPLLGVYYEPIWPIITSANMIHSFEFKVTNTCAISVGGAQLLLSPTAALLSHASGKWTAATCCTLSSCWPHGSLT